MNLREAFMASKLLGGGSGGGGGASDGILGEVLARTISGTFADSTITALGGFAFAGCTQLQAVSLPACTKVGESAFLNAYNMSQLYLPQVTSIGRSAFLFTSALEELHFPLLSSLAQAQFYGCGARYIEVPLVQKVPYSGFANCSRLQSVYAPLVETIDTYGFMQTALSEAVFPNAKSVGTSAFNNCSQTLVMASFPSLSVIYSDAFRRCFHLVSFYLLGDQVCTLSNQNAFSSTPIGGYTASVGGQLGSVFVKASLLESYRVASMW